MSHQSILLFLIYKSHLYKTYPPSESLSPDVGAFRADQAIHA